MIEDGKKVTFDYTLTVDGKTVDTTEGKNPMEYTQGQGQIIPGLEKEMAGMTSGEEKKIDLKAVDAYGEVNPEAVQEVPRSMFPSDLKLQAGMAIPLQDKEGRQFTAVLEEIRDEIAVLNFNHPLAGKDLSFDIKIVNVE